MAADEQLIKALAEIGELVRENHRLREENEMLRKALLRGTESIRKHTDSSAKPLKPGTTWSGE